MDVFRYGRTTLHQADCLKWLAEQPPESIHGCITDPPYGLVEYSDAQQAKLRAGRGGVWRIPPAFDGHRRSPLPRFTTLTDTDLAALRRFFTEWGSALLPILTPGAYVVVASNPLVSDLVSVALREAGLERRGEIVRLVQTMRGGDRPKNAHLEFPDVSAMPRSQWEPWLLFRKPLPSRVADSLRRWGTGGLRRINHAQPFGDVIASRPAPPSERRLARPDRPGCAAAGRRHRARPVRRLRLHAGRRGGGRLRRGGRRAGPRVRRARTNRYPGPRRVALTLSPAGSLPRW
jgi:site-specific DNA-methyltransferase (adenine-specific)